MKPQCEGTTTFAVTDFGFREVRCHRRLGLTFYVDETGTIHYGCRDHIARIKRHAPPAQWTEAELREAFGG